MEKISKGIIFSYDIKRILSGLNAYDYVYESIPSEKVIEDIRRDFILDVNKIFNNNVTIITEDEMLRINSLIGGEYPHCNTR